MHAGTHAQSPSSTSLRIHLPPLQLVMTSNCGKRLSLHETHRERPRGSALFRLCRVLRTRANKPIRGGLCWGYVCNAYRSNSLIGIEGCYGTLAWCAVRRSTYNSWRPPFFIFLFLLILGRKNPEPQEDEQTHLNHRLILNLSPNC